MALLFWSDIDPADWWRDALGESIADLDFRVWPEVGNPDDIDFALVWEPHPGSLRTFANLKAIFSLGAGVDHLLCDPDLPPGVPITRVVDPNMTQRMTEYVVLHVLRYHRQHDDYEEQQRRIDWTMRPQPAAGERCVGVMGLGELGGNAVRALAALGLDVAGYSRTPKRIDGVTGFHGADGLAPFLERTEILVNLLPLTPALENILDARLFTALPVGAFVINAGRGRHLVETDLLAALDSGHLGGATMDVFREEPLPDGHPFWTHPKVSITPHVAAIADPRFIARQVAENIERARAGQPLLYVVDPAVGY